MSSIPIQPGTWQTVTTTTIPNVISSHNHNLTFTSGDNTITMDDTWNYTVAAKLLGMYLEGKDLEKNKQEYLDAIFKLPGVNNDSLKAVEVFERLKKISKALCL